MQQLWTSYSSNIKSVLLCLIKIILVQYRRKYKKLYISYVQKKAYSCFKIRIVMQLGDDRQVLEGVEGMEWKNVQKDGSERVTSAEKGRKKEGREKEGKGHRTDKRWERDI